MGIRFLRTPIAQKAILGNNRCDYMNLKDFCIAKKQKKSNKKKTNKKLVSEAIAYEWDKNPCSYN